MPTLVRKTQSRLWEDAHYDMALLADGARWDCHHGRGGDYRCRHRSFTVLMQRWAREHGCVVKCAPLVASGAEHEERIGTSIQFFWDLRPGAATPRRFRNVGDDYIAGTGVPEWGPQIRSEYADYPFEHR
jgi:hypothetical protein